MEIADEVNQKGLLYEIKLHTAVDIGLTFSAMMRLFEGKSKDTLHKEIYSELQSNFFNAKTPSDFKEIHSKFCKRVMSKISLAKKEGNASYGQIAKTLDVVLKVVIYYSHLPNCTEAKRLSKLLNVAMDRKMMNYLRRKYLDDKERQAWPKKVEDVREEKTYDQVQEAVSRYRKEYAKDKHLGELLPSQLEDILWARVNEKFWSLTPKLSKEKNQMKNPKSYQNP
jgi:hypothetical protein